MLTELQVDNMPTFKELLDFIVSHKGNRTFLYYDIAQIAFMVKEALDENSLYFALDSNNKITGMILAKVSSASKTIWVEENLAMTMNNLKQFVRKAKTQFPGYNIEGFKHSRCKNFNKFIERIK
jgi:hypothetical protein